MGFDALCRLPVFGVDMEGLRILVAIRHTELRSQVSMRQNLEHLLLTE